MEDVFMRKLLKRFNIAVAALAVLVGSVALPQTAGAVSQSDENLSGVNAETLKVLKDDSEGKTTIPYTRFWDKGSGGSSLFLRSSNSYGVYPYVSAGGYEASYYDRSPLNWRMIQAGKYRLLKNSSTGKCISSYYYQSVITMKTCNTSDSNQKLTINYDSGFNSLYILANDGFYGAIHESFHINPHPRNGERIIMAPGISHRWSYVNPR